MTAFDYGIPFWLCWFGSAASAVIAFYAICKLIERNRGD